VIGDDDVLRYGNFLCVPNVNYLKAELIAKAYKIVYAVHPCSTKKYQDLKVCFWWNKMKADVANFVSRCLTCQRVNCEHQKSLELLQPLFVSK